MDKTAEISEAISNLLVCLKRTNVTQDEALKFSQAVANLTTAWERIKLTST